MHNETPKPLPPTLIEYREDFVLRPPNASDFEKIETAFEQSVHDLRKFMEWSHNPLPKEKQIERIMEQYARYFLGIEYELAMFDKKTGELLYYSGVYPINRINPKAYEMGFWVSSKHKGKGHATLGTRILIALFFEYFKADRLEITASIENQASLRVIEKCGFKKEGELRNFYPQGTEEMFKNGYTKERRVYAFSLIPEDRNNLSWYDEILSETRIYPLFKGPLLLETFSGAHFS